MNFQQTSYVKPRNWSRLRLRCSPPDSPRLGSPDANGAALGGQCILSRPTLLEVSGLHWRWNQFHWAKQHFSEKTERNTRKEGKRTNKNGEVDEKSMEKKPHETGDGRPESGSTPFPNKKIPRHPQALDSHDFSHPANRTQFRRDHISLRSAPGHDHLLGLQEIADDRHLAVAVHSGGSLGCCPARHTEVLKGLNIE